jgi:hypothetical protein
VLQYRSVAFVTYVHEVHAQFAKEAMACQSLDNDEILNVRWATEDPNPTQKVAEKRRLEEMGQEAIKSRMDPKIVEAMRAVRALEEGEPLDHDEQDMIEGQEWNDEDEEMQGPESKRRRVEAAAPPQQQPGGLLNADTLESLKYFAEIRKRNGGTQVPSAPKPPPAKLVAGLGLADYGSDDED